MNEIEQLALLKESIVRLEEGTYWGHNGRYEKQANELESLVPSSGPSKTLRGEIFRAAQKIYYDYNNNGFGNSWEAPATFLMAHVNLSADVMNMLVRYAAGNMPDGDIDAVVEEMLDTTVKKIYPMADRPNHEDMWDTDYNRNDFDDEPNAWDDEWDDEEEEEEEY